MARVNVDDLAFDDSRFGLLADAVPHLRDRWHALGYVLRVWHACASRSIKAVRAEELAYWLGYRRPLKQADAAVIAFCDAAQLGERTEGGMVRVKGTDGRTDYLEADDGDDLVEAVKAHVIEHGPAKRSDIMRALELQRSQRTSFYNSVRRAVLAGVLVEEAGLIAAPAFTNPSTSSPRPVQSTSIQRSLVPALVLDLVPERQDTHTACARDGIHPASKSVHSDVHVASRAVHTLDEKLYVNRPSSVHVEQDVGRSVDVVSRLYAYHRAVVKRHGAEELVKDLGEYAVRHTILEARMHQSLMVEERDEQGKTRKAPRPPEEIERALDILGVQAHAKADAGEDDPWWPLKKAWSPRVLASALLEPDEKTAKASAVRRSRASPRERPGVATAPNEHYRDLAMGEAEI